MLIKNLLALLSVSAGLARAGDLCAYPVGAQAHCDVSATHVCCNNFNTNECCTFVQQKPNSNLGGSVSCENIGNNDECQSYQGGFPGCTQFIGQVLGPGCIASSTSAGFANFFVADSKKYVKREQACREPNVGVYTNLSGVQKKIAIPTGRYQEIVEYLMEDNFSELALLEEYTG